jgi:putative nucleotidyltransferase with HDIG domain
VTRPIAGASGAHNGSSVADRTALSSSTTVTRIPAATAPQWAIPDVDPDSTASVGAALEAALRARAPSLYASTPVVRQVAAKVSRELGFDAPTAGLLDLAVRVRDVGMIALPDSIVHAIARLTPEEWEIVYRHPVIGARLLETLPPVAVAAPTVLSHHERWDGGGYPDGLSGEVIPLLSRVIAVCDAFVALAHDRPHRRGLGSEVALEHVCQERGVQFDPLIVDALVAGLRAGSVAPRTVPRRDAIQVADRVGSRIEPGKQDEDPLVVAVSEFDVVLAFAPAVERALATIGTQGSTDGELVAAIESDIGLTLAVLRRAQGAAAQKAIVSVPDALNVLTPAEVETAITSLPLAAFPWRTSPIEILLHRGRVHAQAVMRAADRIARELNVSQRDEVLVVALLHDVGKLVLTRIHSDYGDAFDVRTGTPEQRIREEQRAPGRDHATLGAFMIRRWGLPDRLVRAVASHHRSEAPDEVATYVRLADMVAHHGQGDAVDRATMLQLCRSCGLSVDSLRNVLFDLPHSGGSWMRRAQPSPLTERESEIVRLLAQGKIYKVIGQDLGVATSTVRSHVQNMYEKLGVIDRAQAVLRATEMGWI